MRSLWLLLLLFAAPKQPDVPAPGDFWKKLPPPREGEWRWRFPEEGETFAEYRAAKPIRPTAERTRIYLQPFLTRVPRDTRLLTRIATVFEGFFGREVKVLGPRALPAGAYIDRRRQVSVFGLVPRLVEQLPADALFLLAVTDRDLFVGRLNHVYGWGSRRLRVGVMSTRRVAVGQDEARVRWRTITLATHEAGHLLSLAHCTFFRCLMNGANTLKESDARPGLLCPVCRAKLCWNLDLDPLDRYAALAAAYGRAGLVDAGARVRAASDATRATQKG